MKTKMTMNRCDGLNLWPQSAAGLLLLALLAANPLQAPGQGVIDTSSTTGANLNFLFGPPINSVTVNPGVTLDNTTSGNNAVVGNTHSWDLINDSSTLNGRVNGVYLQAGGSVANNSGFITGGQNGVRFSGSYGSVVNTGTIIGTNNAGVLLENSGGVDNQFFGTIQGKNFGVDIQGGPGSVTNAGTISGATKDGVFLEAGGSVNNQSGGTIMGNNHGVRVENGPGSVVNNGTIMGTNKDGVYLKFGGSVDNQSGTIQGNQNGVEVQGFTGFVTNAGTISGGTRGVDLQAGGSVRNRRDGIITGGTDGVGIQVGVGSVVNNGTIIGTNNDGVHMTAGGSVDNKRHGTISGGQNGVEITGGEGTVNNSGTITGINNDGVYLDAGGSVYNSRHGTISGGRDGVHISSPVVFSVETASVDGGSYYTVDNSGTITGTNRDGVLLENGGNVYNGRRGTISGGRDGVHISSSAPTPAFASLVEGGYTVDNSGTITGINRDGVLLENGGNVYNGRDGTISGGRYGVEISTPSIINLASAIVDGGPYYTVKNYGSISGYDRDGVRLWDGGNVYNGRDGTISGGRYGVEISTPLIINLASAIVDGGPYYTVENYGSISGYDRDGVRLWDGGSVYNGSGGDIHGKLNGVNITGGPATVINAGRIIGNGGTAILMDNFNNTVTLQTGSHVRGDIVGGSANDAAFLEGHGTYGYNFLNFETLTVQASGYRGWNLKGTNTFSTGATVEGGLLRINGELDTPLLTVSNSPDSLYDAGLGGSGVINGIVDNHGYFAPGNSIGTLTINGSMTNGGNYQVQVNTTTNDFILVNGTATITGGNVIVQPDRQIYGSNTVYTILTATNGVSGAYGTSYIEPQFSPYVALFLTSSLSNDLDNVYLTLHREKFTIVANTYNQNSVAGALDGIVDSPTPGMSNLVTEFFWLPSAGAARAALDSMSGEIHGTLGMLDVQQQDAFNNSIALRTGRMSAGGGSGDFATSWKPVQLASAGSTLPPMQQAEANRPLDIWLQGFGSFGHLDGDGNAMGGDYTISGLSGGLDYRVCPELLVGLGLGYSHDNADVGGPGANGKVDAYQIAGYGGYVSGPWHLDGILSYGYLQTDTKRFINVGSIHQEADGSYDGGVFSLSTEGGYAFKFNWLTVEPTLGLKYSHLWQDNFSETGTATDGHNYGLNVHNVNMDSVRTALGVRLAAQFGKKDGVQFIPALRAAWEHEFVDRYADLNASFVGGSGDFNVRGVELGADTAILGGGLTVAFNKAIQGFVNYDANLNSQLTSSTISGGLSISW